MSRAYASSAISGAAFGAALLLSGICSPSVIRSQMDLSDSTLFQIFLSISASSAIVLSAFERLNIAKISPRSPSPLKGISGRYGGNIIGGSLQGLAMTLTNSSPETLLVQLSTGKLSTALALRIFLGCILGGIVYTASTGLAIPSKRRSPPTLRSGSQLPNDNQSSTTKVNDQTQSQSPAPPPLSIPTHLHIPSAQVLPVYALSCILLNLTLSILTTGSPSSATILSGTFIGLSQALCILLTGASLGVSGMYESLGIYFWWLVRRSTGYDLQRGRGPNPRILWFAGGIGVGARVVVMLVGGGEGLRRLMAAEEEEEVPGLGALGAGRAVFGGVVMAIGARMAGGCTSGHGISGVSALSDASLITLAAICVGGVASARFLNGS